MTKGSSQRGGLGAGQPGAWQTSDIPFPIEVDKDIRFKSIQAGEKHVLALTTDGKVYAWGDNQFGQVGLHDKFKKDSQFDDKNGVYVFKPTMVFPTDKDPNMQVKQI